MKQPSSEIPSGVYKLQIPNSGTLPILIDSPHSGRVYPNDFNYVCPRGDLEAIEDNYVDMLLEGAAAQGITTLNCLIARSYIDMNRRVDDIDPQLMTEQIAGAAPGKRSYAGYGLIHRLTRPGVPIYSRALSSKEVTRRIDHYYTPYHTTLQQELDRLFYSFGSYLYIDLHSMPSVTARDRSGHPVDFVIGTRGNTTSAKHYANFISDYFARKGYRVAMNDPYPGVELIHRHGHPARGKHAIQLEVSKALYWDEKELRLTGNHANLKVLFQCFYENLGVYMQKMLVPKAAD